VLTDKTLGDNGARVETSPKKSLTQRVSRTSASRATKLLKLQPYKTTIVYALKEHDLVVVVIINFCN
jgi:hypothetical protein